MIKLMCKEIFTKLKRPYEIIRRHNKIILKKEVDFLDKHLLGGIEKREKKREEKKSIRTFT